MRNPALLFSSVRNIISMLSHLKSTLIIGSKTGKQTKKKKIGQKCYWKPYPVMSFIFEFVDLSFKCFVHLMIIMCHHLWWVTFLCKVEVTFFFFHIFSLFFCYCFVQVYLSPGILHLSTKLLCDIGLASQAYERKWAMLISVYKLLFC